MLIFISSALFSCVSVLSSGPYGNEPLHAPAPASDIEAKSPEIWLTARGNIGSGNFTVLDHDYFVQAGLLYSGFEIMEPNKENETKLVTYGDLGLSAWYGKTHLTNDMYDINYTPSLAEPFTYYGWTIQGDLSFGALNKHSMWGFGIQGNVSSEYGTYFDFRKETAKLDGNINLSPLPETTYLGIHFDHIDFFQDRSFKSIKIGGNFSYAFSGLFNFPQSIDDRLADPIIQAYAIVRFEKFSVGLNLMRRLVNSGIGLELGFTP